MRNVQAHYSRVSSFRADFQQISEMAALEIEESSQGQVYFLRPGMMRWHYKFPHEQIFVFKDGVISLYQPAQRQLLIDDAGDIFITDLPVSFIMGAGDLDQNFEVLRGCRNEAGIVLVMRPRDDARQSQLQMFHLLIDPQSMFPRGALIQDVGGNTTAILLRNEELAIVLSDADFSLKVPPGTDVIDRRRGF
jgi:outer membrane lipoprotein carrier protein